jgi:hypothetical protein
MKIVIAAWACAVLSIVACPANAAGAPAQLYNKTISVSFVLANNGVDEHGRGTGAGRTVYQTIYISSQGRIFLRSDNRGGGIAQTVDRTPEASAGEFRFDGNRIVRAAKGAFSSGALNETISFDSGFQSCMASIQTGHESSKVYKWKSLDGRNITATSFTPSNPTCSISEGNALAR